MTKENTGKMVNKGQSSQNYELKHSLCVLIMPVVGQRTVRFECFGDSIVAVGVSFFFVPCCI